MITVIALDVATRYTGYGMYRYVCDTTKAKLVQYGNIRGGKGGLLERSIRIASSVFTLRQSLERMDRDNMFMVMEYPTFYGGAKGHTASVHGDTIKLGFVCGTIYGMIQTLCGYSIGTTLYTYPSWNGQLPKKVTTKRFFEKFGIYANPNTVDNNFVDACMMGVFHLGTLTPAVTNITADDAVREDL